MVARPDVVVPLVQPDSGVENTRLRSAATPPPATEHHETLHETSGAARPPFEMMVSLDCLVPMDVATSSGRGLRHPANLKVAGPLFDTFPEALAEARDRRTRIEMMPALEELEAIAQELCTAAEGHEPSDAYLAGCIGVLRSTLADIAAARDTKSTL